MNRTRPLMLLILLSLGMLTGCGGTKLLNPYHEDFMCPDGDHGRCESVKEAYQDSFNKEAFSPMVKDGRRPPEKDRPEEYSYKEELYKELSGIIREPVTPMLVPPKQMRVLIPGYTEKGNLYYAPRYIYFIAREARWTLPAIKDEREDLQ